MIDAAQFNRHTTRYVGGAVAPILDGAGGISRPDPSPRLRQVVQRMAQRVAAAAGSGIQPSAGGMARRVGQLADAQS